MSTTTTTQPTPGFQQQKNKIISDLTAAAVQATFIYTQSNSLLTTDSALLAACGKSVSTLQSDLATVEANAAYLAQAITSATNTVIILTPPAAAPSTGSSSANTPTALTATGFATQFQTDAQTMLTSMVETTNNMITAAGEITDLLATIAQTQTADIYYGAYITPDAKTITSNLTKAFSDTVSALTAAVSATATAVHLSATVNETAEEGNTLVELLSSMNAPTGDASLVALTTAMTTFETSASGYLTTINTQTTTDTNANFAAKTASDGATAALKAAQAAAINS